VSRRNDPDRLPKPLNPAKLRDLALHYVGRYATSRAKLATYLTRKIRERGWVEGATAPDIDTMIEDFNRLGYVDDAAYAASRARALTARGFGARRVNEDLRAKGITETDSSEAREDSENARWLSAERFAQRKRIGPFAAEQATPELQHKQFQAFLRAGHSCDIAKAFVRAAPGDVVEFSE
jgi:regulatory protein